MPPAPKPAWRPAPPSSPAVRVSSPAAPSSSRAARANSSAPLPLRAWSGLTPRGQRAQQGLSPRCARQHTRRTAAARVAAPTPALRRAAASRAQEQWLPRRTATTTAVEMAAAVAVAAPEGRRPSRRGRGCAGRASNSKAGRPAARTAVRERHTHWWARMSKEARCGVHARRPLFW